MGSCTIVRAIVVRLLFACHGLVSIWLLNKVTQESRFWYLATSFGFLLVETTITLVRKQGKEWKWFCPSVLIYLTMTVPAIWFLELHELEKRIEHQISSLLNISNTSLHIVEIHNETYDLSAHLGSVLGVKFEIRLPINLSPDEWIRTLEQLLLLLLILGRWMLPKGKLTHDQLSQLLLVYIGTAADIVEFFEAFKEKEVRFNKLLCISILGLWSLSLIQFTLVLTAARARRDQSGLVSRHYNVKQRKYGCCAADVYGILISIILQDLPFLVLRLLLIFKFNVLSYTNMFFTSKNTLVILLLVYRLVVVFIERRSEGIQQKYNNLKSKSDHSRPVMSSKYNGPGIPRSKPCNGNVTTGEKASLVQMDVCLDVQPSVYKLSQEKNNYGRNYNGSKKPESRF
ncbi:transmembrane protein 26-like [Saccostrea echinata]|uniref:transmembrane protein 26-like n=1 Tax=Saccostrea echinata TaxID=191078 RepID=UPI002A7F90D1|nr:transmembrane protein 26-like [Saccostrea echinata]